LDAQANGPDDAPLDWDAIDWRRAEQDVARLRRRIYAAEQAGDRKRVANLQRLLLRSRANTLVSVRQVTELNAGRKTAGIDGKLALGSRDKAELADRLQRSTAPWCARPVKRVYIPKSNGKLRPLGIPTIADRAQQNRVRNALEPQWEARFEPRSYGFRPGRGCHDAIEAVFVVARGKNAKRLWVLDLDLRAAFDHIDHEFLLSQLCGFPAKGMVRKWLKAGVVEQGSYSPTEEGTPQGGGISPLLLNVALHGMEAAAGVRHHLSGTKAGEVRAGSPALVRYADDALVLCHSKEQAEQVKLALAEWLESRGLAFNEDKTRIVRLEQGCDFLGFTIRRFNGKLLIKPSAEAIRRIRRRLRDTVRSLYGANAAAVVRALVPIIRGWAAYQRTVVSSEVFAALDTYLWGLLFKWATRCHPHKPKRWVVKRYFGRFNKSRQDHWIFGDRRPGGQAATPEHSDVGPYVPKFSWTKIVRHIQVKGRASPDDPTLIQYWADRGRKQAPPVLSAERVRLLRQQQGRCAACGDLLLHADRQPQSLWQWEQWATTVRMAIRRGWIIEGTSDQPDDRCLIHASCRSRTIRGPARPHTPTGLA